MSKSEFVLGAVEVWLVPDGEELANPAPKARNRRVREVSVPAVVGAPAVEVPGPERVDAPSVAGKRAFDQCPECGSRRTVQVSQFRFRCLEHGVFDPRV